VLAFAPGGTFEEWNGADRIDLGTVMADFELTVNELFAALTR